MKKFLIGLRSLGILLGVWLVLGVIALIGGVFPGLSDSDSGGSARHGDRTARAVDAGADAGADADAGETEGGTSSANAATSDGGAPLAANAADAGADAAATAAAGMAIDSTPVMRTRVCAGDVFDPVLVAADVLRSGASELLVGCGDSFSLLSVENASGDTRLSRVARFTLSDAAPGAEARARDVAAGDIDMDGRVDLLFGFVLLRPGQGGPQGGALDWVGRTPNSGFTPGHRLAPIAATRVMLRDVDGRPGADPVALNATDPHGRRLSEVWVFSGGASPERLAKPSVGRGGLDIALLDLDGDDHLDLAALSREDPKLTLFFGDGAGAFEGLTALSLPSGSRLTVGSRQASETGAGQRNLLVSGAGWFHVDPGVREQISVTPTPLRDAERAARVEGLARIVSDGDVGMIGLLGHDLVAPNVEQGAERVALRVVRSFPPSFLPLAFATAELDGRRGVDLAALGRGTAPNAPLELVIVSDFLFDAPSSRGDAPRRDPVISLADSLAPLRDAPLSLRVSLP